MNRLDKFDIVIRRGEDRVTASVPQLSLYATAADIPEAINALEQKKMALLKELDAAGMPDGLVETATPVVVAETPASNVSQVLLTFSLKLAIVFAVVAVTVVIMANLIARKIQDLAVTAENTRIAWETTLKGYSGAQFWGNIEKNLDHMARSDISGDKREKIMSDIRVIRDRWWPFIAQAIPPDVKSR